MSNADTQLLRQEARSVLKEAMLAYPGAPSHVTLYVLTRAREWNELQADLARTVHPSDPEHVSTIVKTVEEHLESELRSYLDIGSTL